MLNKYWNSPALALTVRPSAVRRHLCVLLALLVSLANYLVFDSGSVFLAVAFIPLSLFCLLRMLREPLIGCSFGWREGQWYVFSGGHLQAVELVGRPVCITGYIQIKLESCLTQEQFNLSLFSDSAVRDDLRRLRCRLILKR